MTRIENWEVALYDAICEARLKPFSWQTGGCAGMVLRCVVHIRGSSPVMPPKLRNATDAERWLRKNGFSCLGDAFAHHFEEINVVYAGRGDIGIGSRAGRETAVIFSGLQWVGQAEDGLLELTRPEITRAFKV